jgi:hypothetical protein
LAPSTRPPTPAPTSRSPTPSPTVTETTCRVNTSNGGLQCSCNRSSCATCDFSRNLLTGLGVPGACTQCVNNTALLHGYCVDPYVCLGQGATVTGAGIDDDEPDNLVCACDDRPEMLQTQAVAESIAASQNSTRLVYYPSCAAASFLCPTTRAVQTTCRTTCSGGDVLGLC